MRATKVHTRASTRRLSKRHSPELNLTRLIGKQDLADLQKYHISYPSYTSRFRLLTNHQFEFLELLKFKDTLALVNIARSDIIDPNCCSKPCPITELSIVSSIWPKSKQYTVSVLGIDLGVEYMPRYCAVTGHFFKSWTTRWLDPSGRYLFTHLNRPNKNAQKDTFEVSYLTKHANQNHAKYRTTIGERRPQFNFFLQQPNPSLSVSNG